MGPVGPMGFPWEWDSLLGMGVGRGMAEWEWVGIKTPHYPIYHSQVVDHQTLLMDPSFCIVICRRLHTAMLDFTLRVHETLLALTLHV